VGRRDRGRGRGGARASPVDFGRSTDPEETALYIKNFWRVVIGSKIPTVLEIYELTTKTNDPRRIPHEDKAKRQNKRLTGPRSDLSMTR
jgi:hypothetical protein